ncbi:MAG: hypothetical protein LUE61_09105 [Clostridiales bacterium]|nr:hypothetical protein [Clostridiales bacterium]
MNQFQAGAGCGTILFPPEMFPLEGFRGIHDDPRVRVLTLKEGGSRAAIVAIEIVMLPDSMIEELRQLVGTVCGVPAEQVFIHVTHAITTPHNPMMMPPFARPEGAERIGALHREAVLAAARQAAEQAAASLQPVTVGCASGRCAVNCNRDEETPSGWWIGRGGSQEANQEMTVLRFSNEAGQPVAFCISYALKTCAIDNAGMEGNLRLVSSDVAGKACQLMEAQYGVPTLFLMSAAANHVPRETALWDEVQPDGTVKTVDKGVECGLALVDTLGAEMGSDAIAIAAQADAGNCPAGLKTDCTSFPWQALGRIEKAPTLGMDYPLEEGRRQVDVSALTFGDYAFVFGKAEMTQPTQQAIQAVSPYPHTFLVTMVNGGFKYIPEAGAYDRFTWEAQSSFVAKGAAERFAEQAAVLLKKLNG